jgi:hypothetical protein
MVLKKKTAGLPESKWQMFVASLKTKARLPGYRRKVLIVFFHTIFLLFLTILLQYISLMRIDEVDFLKYGGIIKHDVLNIDEKPWLNHVVFIDVSKDPAVAEDTEYGPPDSTLKGAQHVITDRFKLARLFKALADHRGQYDYVLCDILFDQPGPGDSLLRPQIEKIHNLVSSATWENGKLLRPIYKIPSAVVNYTAINKVIFTKIPIYYNDTLKSLPAFLMEKMSNNRLVRKGSVTLLNNKVTFNTVIPEFYYRPNDMVTASAGKNFNTFYLGELLADPDFFNVLKGKFIIIGDFANDIHSTYMGKMPGTLILWNSFLTLYQHPSYISLGWLLMLFFFYFIVSYWVIIHPDQDLKEIHKKIRIPFLSKFIISYISFVGVLIIINIFSYFFFGTFISLLYISTYLTVVQVGIEKLPKWRKELYEYIVNM